MGDIESLFGGVTPWVVITAVVTWIGQAFLYKKDWKQMQLDYAAKVESSRDDLAVELLSSARSEIITARAEMETLREEMKTLRSMEQHFYHFQQALEHLSAVLFARDPHEREVAERNARAFLTRMETLQAAKGTMAAQLKRMGDELKHAEEVLRPEEKA